MKYLLKFLTVFLSVGMFVTSCSDDDDFNGGTPLGDYENGILVSGEGSLLSGSVAFVSVDLTTVETDIYAAVNGEDLGNYLQSIGFEGNKAYIVVDNTNTITVVNRYTFEKIATITSGLSMPRHIDFEDGKGYVSNWGDPFDPTDDFVAVINLSTNTVETTISVGNGPEQVLEENGKVYVSHKGAYSMNNIISVIDIATHDVSSIEVADNPDEMFINDAGQLVVLSEGASLYDDDWNYIGSTPGAITKINTTTNTVISSISLEGTYVGLMAYEDGKLYYINNNAVYVMNDSATSLPTTPIITLSAGYAYGLSVDDNRLFVCDASFTGLSTLYVYSLATNSEIATFEVGQGASKVYFN